MDPITAFSIAGTVVQFVDFSCRVLTTTKELYKSSSGNVSLFQNFELVATDLYQLSQRLSNLNHGRNLSGGESISPKSVEADNTLYQLCAESSAIALELLTRFNKLRAQGSGTKFKSFAKAMKSVFSESDIQEMMRRLSEVRGAIQMHLLVDLRAELNALTSIETQNLSGVDQSTRNLIAALSDHEDKLDAQTAAITKLVGRVDLISQDQRLTLQAVSEIDEAKSTLTSTENIKQTSFLKKVISSPNWPGNVSGKQEEYMRLRATDLVLSELVYPTVHNREEAISDAHQETFKWIFSDQTHYSSNFMDWLRRGNGVYWINGKAGSGKSTLMKYVSENRRTKSLLREWAEDLDLMTARFYFWISGTLEQRSQSGLLRSVLYEILSQDKSLVPSIFPHRWAPRYSKLAEPFGYHDKETYAVSDTWSLGELTLAFEKMIQETTCKKICLFIDGLDEYEGDHEQLANLFQKLSTSTQIKICTSSRPLLVLQDTFGSDSIPSFRLQELTCDDIKSYVTSRFETNRHFDRLRQRELAAATNLMENVVARADGVFLWVKLVVTSLLEGLSNRDSLRDLQRRLELIPDDLEDLFESMWNKVDSFYQEKAARVFQIIRASQKVSETYEFDPSDLKEVDAVSLSLALETALEASIGHKASPMTPDERADTTKEMEARLKVYCAGLVETGRTGRVTYLHRSVRDYLERSQNIQKISTQATQSSKFDPHKALLISYIFQAQRIHRDQGDEEAAALILMPFLHACHAQEESQKDNLNVLYSLTEAIIRDGFNRLRHSSVEPELRAENYFPFLLVRWNLIGCMKNYLDDPRFVIYKMKNDSTLCYAAVTDRVGAGGIPLTDRFLPRPDMVDLLLSHGFDPDGESYITTDSPWRCILREISSPKSGPERLRQFARPDPELPPDLKIIKLMLDHGAPPGYFRKVDGGYVTIRLACVKAVQDSHPAAAKILDQIFEDFGGKTKLSFIKRIKGGRRMLPDV
ncbi:hypothetical protein FQN54_000817 [Arachnomyces sp. PD_36]|nr:hypothetical protein FQN54_000817 [Arachnomyces sp. PD_36]